MPSRQLFFIYSYNQIGAGGYRFRPQIGAGDLRLYKNKYGIKEWKIMRGIIDKVGITFLGPLRGQKLSPTLSTSRATQSKHLRKL
jgi:hypothetical protein